MFILCRTQSILHVKILFYNFNAHATGLKKLNTLPARKLTMFSASKSSLSGIKMRENILS